MWGTTAEGADGHHGDPNAKVERLAGKRSDGLRPLAPWMSTRFQYARSSRHSNHFPTKALIFDLGFARANKCWFWGTRGRRFESCLPDFCLPDFDPK
jgi:hypothetical protein